MQPLVKRIQTLADQVDSAIDQLKLAADETQLAALDAKMAEPDFWNDPDAAASTSQQAATLRKHVDGWRDLQVSVNGLKELAAMDDSSIADELTADLEEVEAEYAQREFELMLGGPYDKNGAVITISAGAGGTDAQDWAQMLQRMYLRYAERGGLNAAAIDESPGEEAGIKSATIEITGPYAYGKLKSEKGVHRLVRLSPFNSDNLRQTSFAMIDVVPLLDNPDEVDIDPKDLRIDVFRSGGNGGQSVNTTDSAVRITHIPTNTVVAIQNERSQLQNKEKAMAILKARLTVLMEEQHKAKIDELRGAPTAAEWGSQIRSYVLHPYTKVKDHRTNYETSDAQAVLDGEIEPFSQAYLKHQMGK